MVYGSLAHLVCVNWKEQGLACNKVTTTLCWRLVVLQPTLHGRPSNKRNAKWFVGSRQLTARPNLPDAVTKQARLQSSIAVAAGIIRPAAHSAAVVVPAPAVARVADPVSAALGGKHFHQPGNYSYLLIK